MKHLIFFAAAMLCGDLFFTAPQPSESSAETYVYICTGSSSKRYHRTTECKGLSNCKGEVKKITKAYAEQKGRTPCKLCYGH